MKILSTRKNLKAILLLTIGLIASSMAQEEAAPAEVDTTTAQEDTEVSDEPEKTATEQTFD